MTHAVMRGDPTPAQLYLEDIIKELISETGREDDRYSVSCILYKCLRDHPQRLAFIDGKTDIRATNIELLRKAVKVARALTHSGYGEGDVAMLIGWNHLQYAATYYGALFAGITLFMVETLLTAHELQYYINLTKPKVIIVTADKVEDVKQAQKEQIGCKVVVFNETAAGSEQTEKGDITFSEFVKAHSDSIDDYWPVKLDKDATAALFTTGGSTGLGPPKLAPITHAGLVSQAPTEWTYFDRFPHPTDICMTQFNGQWLVHTKIFVSAVIYGVTILTRSERPNVETVLDLLTKYKPSWMMIGPGDMAYFLNLPQYKSGDLHCLKSLILVGLTPYRNLISMLKKEVLPDTRICNRYGMTEAHGYVCLGDRNEVSNVGPVVNIFEYKLVDEEGNAVAPNNKGELYLKSKYCITKTYYGDETAAREMFTEDGWFRTGDVLVESQDGDLRYVERLKFIVYNQEYPISPQELEEVVCSVEGVAAAVVCGTEDGPAALVVPHQGFSPSRDAINKAFKNKLSEYKQLSGGIAFVASLPRTHVGKLHRRKCTDIIKELRAKNECF